MQAFLAIFRYSLRVVLERENAALDRANNNMATLEVGIHRPRAVKRRLATNLIILGPHIKEGRLLKQRAGVILVNGRDVDDAQPRAVVGLVRQAVDDVLVVVDGLLRALVDATEHGVR